jgi:ferric-dicitrate binding protein FerR (iron transport regulator)
MNLPDYTLQDFLQDASFSHWVYKTDTAAEQMWDALLAAHPEKKAMAHQAALLLTGISVISTPVPDSQLQASWSRLKHRLDSLDNTRRMLPTQEPGKLKNTYWPNWAAALLIFCLSSTFVYYLANKQKEQIYHTQFGETATIILPDSSTVVLNGNTTLRYAANQDFTKNREVWLEGEAFFSVLRKPGPRKVHFLVHTPEVNVQVLGTRFNVTNRRRKTRVVLNSGKVNLSTETPTKQPITATLKPGEMAELLPAQQKFKKSQVDPEIYSAWTHKKLIFQATPLSDIVALLEENYGYTVRVSDRKILTRKITGEIFIDDVNTLLVALSTSFNLKIEKQAQQTLRITSPM